MQDATLNKSGINRIRLEFKVKLCYNKSMKGVISINRIRLEFKDDIVMGEVEDEEVLIESDWNLK